MNVYHNAERVCLDRKYDGIANKVRTMILDECEGKDIGRHNNPDSNHHDRPITFFNTKEDKTNKILSKIHMILCIRNMDDINLADAKYVSELVVWDDIRGLKNQGFKF